MPRALPIGLATLALAGCGNERTKSPDVDTPAAPSGSREIKLRDADVRFKAPQNWPDLPAQGARAGGIRSGRATVAVWRYPRREAVPRTRTALEQVRSLLVERVTKRDFNVRSSRVLARGVEIVGTQRIGGLPIEVRSRHLFRGSEEIVVDAYAPPEHFDRVDDTVFEPLLRSLRLGA